ncbi:DNA polymerase I, thermostable [compost metagenome]
MKLLIDGNNLAYRANATTELTTKQGERVSAIFGTLQMIQSYLKESEGKYKNKMLDSLRLFYKNPELLFNDVVTCWDAGKSKQRMTLFPEYKANRKKEDRTEEEKAIYAQFIDQMEQLHKVLPVFGIRSVKVKGWEGDDLIYVASQLTDDVCVIVSTDKDMLQLVSDKVLVWSPFKEKLITPSNFQAETGLPQESYLHYRTLVGDSSDNINGVKGIGEKTGTTLLLKYKDITGLIAAKDELMKSKRTQKIFEDLSLLDRNNELMNLRKVDYTDVKDYVLEQMEKSTSFQDKNVKMFLASKQFVKILSDYLMWSMPFRMLGMDENE